MNPDGKMVRCVTRNLDHVKVLQVVESVVLKETVGGSVQISHRTQLPMLTCELGKRFSAMKRVSSLALDGALQKGLKVSESRGSKVTLKRHEFVAFISNQVITNLMFSISRVKESP